MSPDQGSLGHTVAQILHRRLTARDSGSRAVDFELGALLDREVSPWSVVEAAARVRAEVWKFGSATPLQVRELIDALNDIAKDNAEFVAVLEYIIGLDSDGSLEASKGEESLRGSAFNSGAATTARESVPNQGGLVPLDQPISLDDLVGTSQAAGPFPSLQTPVWSTPQDLEHPTQSSDGDGAGSSAETNFTPLVPAKREPKFVPLQKPPTPLPGAEKSALEDDVPTRRLPIYQSVHSRWFSDGDEVGADSRALPRDEARDDARLPRHAAADDEVQSQSVSGLSFPRMTRDSLPHVDEGWRSAADAGWNAAQSVFESKNEEITAAGLPKRVPNAYLVPGAVGKPSAVEPDQADAPDGTAGQPGPAAIARSAAAVRSRMASFQRGYTAGRHRAVEVADSHGNAAPAEIAASGRGEPEAAEVHGSGTYNGGRRRRRAPDSGNREYRSVGAELSAGQLEPRHGRRPLEGEHVEYRDDEPSAVIVRERLGPVDVPPAVDSSRGGDRQRYLHANLPTRAPLSEDLSLVVRITQRRAPSAHTAASTPLKSFPIPPQGAQVTILVHAPDGLVSRTSLRQTITVPLSGDAEPVLFDFRARVTGLHQLQVMAWTGGTFLGELTLQVSVEHGGGFVEREPVVAPLEDVTAHRGEVTLLVLSEMSEQRRYMFQLLSDQYLFEPVLAQSLSADPSMAVERAVDTLRQMAQGRGLYTPDNARNWMRETGIGLWEDVVPDVIKEQFWQLRGDITSFTVATKDDVLPWELLYPLRAESDHGFLVEQFPVLRRVFRQQRSRLIGLDGCSYVVSRKAPVDTERELAAVAEILGQGPVVRELGDLLSLIGSGRCGPLHFSCHNSFELDKGGSSIAMSGGAFVPTLLNSAVVTKSLSRRAPMVFLNACRTAGVSPEYSRMIGWAQQFMAAGAGAFVGTLWPVRSETAGSFAELFYGNLRAGDTLGAATHKARLSASKLGGIDPTWLAYSVYGDPDATAA